MFSAAERFRSPIPKHGKMGVTAGEKFNEESVIAAQGRILKDRATGENVLDIRDSRQAMACAILMVLNGGYLRVGQATFTRISNAGREVRPTSVVCNVQVACRFRGTRKRDEVYDPVAIRVHFMPATEGRKAMAVINQSQADRAGLTKADMAENGGIFTVM